MLLLYFTFPLLIYLKTGTLYFLTSFTHFPPFSVWTWVFFVVVVVVVCLFVLDSTYKQNHVAFVFLWLTSLSIIPSSPSMLLHMARFILLYGWVVFHCIYKHIFFIQSSIHGSLHCFHMLDILMFSKENIHFPRTLVLV